MADPWNALGLVVNGFLLVLTALKLAQVGGVTKAGQAAGQIGWCEREGKGSVQLAGSIPQHPGGERRALLPGRERKPCLHPTNTPFPATPSPLRLL